MKILGVSCTRSDYDLLSGVYQALHARPDVEFRLLVGGAHLSSTFGDTVQDIRKEGLPILAEIESLIDSNSLLSRVKTGAIFMQTAGDIIAGYRPDIVIYAGDREDALAVAIICAYLRTPTIHCFGGDHGTDGHVDNTVRHAISKLSTFHFVSNESHRKRLLSIGEDAERAYVIGSPALDKFRTERWLSKEEIFRSFHVEHLRTDTPYAVLIYHPAFGEEDRAGTEVSNILNVLQKRGIWPFVSSPNPDSGCRDILRIYAELKSLEQFTFYRNAPRLIFINLLRHAQFLIGNSSLGIIETPSVPLAAINVGSRQRGRLAAQNVLFTSSAPSEIEKAVDRVNSPEFREAISRVGNPYGDGHSIDRAIELILKLDYQRWLLKREDPLVSWSNR